MTALLIGYARVSTDGRDLTAQRDGLQALGVPAARVYVDHGLTGTNRDRPGLREAMAAYREFASRRSSIETIWAPGPSGRLISAVDALSCSGWKILTWGCKAGSVLDMWGM